MTKQNDVNQKVYKLLQKIPKGKVTTYGGIAKKLGLNPRHVGRILSQNDHPIEYPCYKVVRSDGSLCGYTIDGKTNSKTLLVKRSKLLKNGVIFRDKKISKTSIVEV